MVGKRLQLNERFGVSDYVVSSDEITKSLMTYDQTGQIDKNLLSAPYTLLEGHGTMNGTTTMQVPLLMAIHCMDGKKGVDVVVSDDCLQTYSDDFEPHDLAKIESVYSGSVRDFMWFPLKDMFREREKIIRDSYLCKDEPKTPQMHDQDSSEKDTF